MDKKAKTPRLLGMPGLLWVNGARSRPAGLLVSGLNSDHWLEIVVPPNLGKNGVVALCDVFFDPAKSRDEAVTDAGERLATFRDPSGLAPVGLRDLARSSPKDWVLERFPAERLLQHPADDVVVGVQYVLRSLRQPVDVALDGFLTGRIEGCWPSNAGSYAYPLDRQGRSRSATAIRHGKRACLWLREEPLPAPSKRR